LNRLTLRLLRVGVLRTGGPHFLEDRRRYTRDWVPKVSLYHKKRNALLELGYNEDHIPFQGIT
jgi:hypothetical protein